MALLSSIARKKASDEISLTGLRIVILQLSEVEEHYSNNTIVVKSGLKSLTQTNPIITTSLSNSNSSSSYYSSVINSSAAKNITTTSSNCFNNGGFNSFLKSCHLCKKPLCPDKDVYMYRGDQGFCSIECRSKQIMVDEMKEMDAKTKNRLRASSIDCQGCETCKLLEDLRQRRIRRNNKFKPLITPAKHEPLLSFS